MSVTLDKNEVVASFDVDCQYTFSPVCPDELPVPDALAIVPELNAQAALASFRIGSKDAHSPQAIWVADEKKPPFSELTYENADRAWVQHAVPGTKGFELLDGLPKITQYDFFVWKGIELDMHPYGACYHDFANKLSTGVIEFFQAKQVTTVIVGGLATDYCVKETALQLLSAAFRVIVNVGACRGIHPDTCQQAIEAIIQKAGIIIQRAAEVTRII